jgi:two-component system, OmpR family, KDP operon response regulator KdpE
MSRVLLIDDDSDLRKACTVGLVALGHAVRTAESGKLGLDDVAIHPPDVVVLDLGLPDVDGMEVCRRIRGWTDVPIIVLSADNSEDRKVDALGGGADDYVTKPFGMRELDARIRVAVRHSVTEAADQQSSLVTVGSLHLDLVHYEATYEQQKIDLTPKEFEFLAYLARHAGKVCTRRMILENVWGPGYVNELDYAKVYAYRIRRKLRDPNGEFLQSDTAIGYRLRT